MTYTFDMYVAYNEGNKTANQLNTTHFPKKIKTRKQEYPNLLTNINGRVLGEYQEILELLSGQLGHQGRRCCSGFPSYLYNVPSYTGIMASINCSQRVLSNETELTSFRLILPGEGRGCLSTPTPSPSLPSKGRDNLETDGDLVLPL